MRSESIFQQCIPATAEDYSQPCLRSQSMWQGDDEVQVDEDQVVPVQVHDETQDQVVPQLEKKKVMAPPMQYDLRKADASTVYYHIKTVIKNDAIATSWIEQQKPAMFAQRAPLVFGYIPAPPNESIIQKVIGYKGHYFKMTTACCGVYFIWHDWETNMFLFWGPSTFKVVKAMNSIRWRIVKYYEVPQQDDTESDDDMPALISMGNTPDYEHPEPC